jgi:PAS domain S-box-containing protein
MTNQIRDALQTLVAGVQDGRSLHEMVETSPLPVLVANDHGSFVMANEMASTLTGYSLSELRSLSLWQITPDVLEREAEILWRAFLQQREQFGTYRLIKKNGQTIVTPYAARTNVVRGYHVSVLGSPTQHV